jgi:predicted nucleic acid-binding protein
LTAYADSSFFVSLYLADQHSEEASRWLPAGPTLWLTPLHLAEWIHAVEQHVFRGKVSRNEADVVYVRFEEHRKTGLWIEADVPDTAFERCVELARQHVARLGNRTLDTLHVAAALELKAERFWTFDERQAKLARAAGLRIRN